MSLLANLTLIHSHSQTKYAFESKMIFSNFDLLITSRQSLTSSQKMVVLDLHSEPSLMPM